MTEEQWKLFRQGKIAVNCVTEEDAADFIKGCYSRDIEWSWFEDNENTIHWWYGQNTAYICDQKKYIGYHDVRNDFINNYEIVKYGKGNSTPKMKTREEIIKEIEKWEIELTKPFYYYEPDGEEKYHMYIESKLEVLKWVLNEEDEEDD